MARASREGVADLDIRTNDVACLDCGYATFKYRWTGDVVWVAPENRERWYCVCGYAVDASERGEEPVEMGGFLFGIKPGDTVRLEGEGRTGLAAGKVKLIDYGRRQITVDWSSADL